MAGGSADAAAVLRAAMAFAPGRVEELDAIAVMLGADVPGQLVPGVSLGTGAGEIVERLAPLAEHAYVVLPSPHALSTPDVYREADRLGLPRDREALQARYEQLMRTLTRSGPPGDSPLRPAAGPPARPPDELLVNDLEPAAVSLCPWCADALAAVRGVGAEHAMVSGSGPTVVGIWWGSEAEALAAGAAAALTDRYPGAVAARPVDAQFALPSLT
jgi:4-diphosphocytidyl-2-C-methyl-D-erythritol kinase